SRAHSESSSSCRTTAAADLRRVYLDDAGSALVLPEVSTALHDVPAGNASSPHSEGRAARAALDRARDTAAAALGAARSEITFVSSGTEAVNLALFGVAGPLVTWAAEHQSALGAARRGLLFVRDGVRLDPLLYGGPQEYGRRAGHEDVPAAVAMAVAISVASAQRDARANNARRQAAVLRATLLELGGDLTGDENR